MALNNTYFESKGRDVSVPIPDTPGYTPPTPPTPPTPGSGSTPSIPRPTYSGNVTITFYNNSSDNNEVNKSITQKDEKTVVFKEDVDLIEPSIVIESDSDVLASNYMYMLSRYYFIKNIDAMPGSLIRINAKVDPLMTYAAAIKSNQAILTRNSNQTNTYIPDGKMKITSYTTVNTIKSTAGFSSSLNYYLLAAGE